MKPIEKLKNAFTSALNLPPNAEVQDAQYGQTDGWDSVAHMALVAEIESAFDIMLDTDQVVTMSSFEKAKEIIGEHGIDFDS